MIKSADSILDDIHKTFLIYTCQAGISSDVVDEVSALEIYLVKECLTLGEGQMIPVPTVVTAFINGVGFVLVKNRL